MSLCCIPLRHPIKCPNLLLYGCYPICCPYIVSLIFVTPAFLLSLLTVDKIIRKLLLCGLSKIFFQMSFRPLTKEHMALPQISENFVWLIHYDLDLMYKLCHYSCYSKLSLSGLALGRSLLTGLKKAPAWLLGYPQHRGWNIALVQILLLR